MVYTRAMRDLYLIGVACVIAIAVGSLLYAFGPGAAGGPASVERAVSFTVLRSGTDGPQDLGRVNYRIRSQEQYAQLWAMLYGADAEPPPAVDFETTEVLAVFDGSHATGGYAVSVAQVTDAASRTVTIERAAPGSSCMVSQSLTAPFELIALPASELTLTHEEEVAVNECA